MGDDGQQRKLPQSAAELLERYATGDRNFSAFLDQGGWQRANLEGANLEGANLEGANLKRAKLHCAHLEGANLQSANLEGADLRRAKLVGAHLEGADLRHADLRRADLTSAHLEGAKLREAHLERADLTIADLKRADLTSAHLEGAKLREAHLERANLTSAQLEGAQLEGAHLEGANLWWANLKGVGLKAAKLENANLLRAKGVVVDHTFVRGAQFSPTSWWCAGPDEWTQLRQKYTGTAMIFNLILLFAFLVPLVARALFWTGVNEGQDRIAAELAPARERVAQLKRELGAASTSPRTRAILAQLHAQLTNENWTRCLKESCAERPVWKVMLNTKAGAASWGLALLLLLYNLGRALLTKFVGPLREQEERSGWTPERDWKLRALIWLHYRVWVLGWVAIAAFGYHGYHWLTAIVSVPA